MKTIKTSKKTYVPTHVEGYNKLRLILKSLFMSNKNSPNFKYLGCKNMDGKKGILVSGLGSQSIRVFDKFYSIDEIKDLLGNYKTLTEVDIYES